MKLRDSIAAVIFGCSIVVIAYEGILNVAPAMACTAATIPPSLVCPGATTRPSCAELGLRTPFFPDLESALAEPNKLPNETVRPIVAEVIIMDEPNEIDKIRIIIKNIFRGGNNIYNKIARLRPYSIDCIDRAELKVGRSGIITGGWFVSPLDGGVNIFALTTPVSGRP